MLSPWDAYRWFEPPVERTVVPGAGMGTVQIAGREVRRVVLMIRPGGLSTSSQVTTDPNATGAGGFLITDGAPLLLTQQQHGNLCQEPWYALGGTGTVTVVEVLLRDWPHTEEGPPDGA